jgi:hypothetical protein
MHRAGAFFLQNFSLHESVDYGLDKSLFQMIETRRRASLEVDPQAPVDTIQKYNCEPGDNDVHEKSGKNWHEVVGHAMRFNQLATTSYRPT